MAPQGNKSGAQAAQPGASAPAKKTKAESDQEKAIKDAFINAPDSPQMLAVIAHHPELAELAKSRDKVARETFGEEFYVRYKQGCCFVILARALFPYDPSKEARALNTKEVDGKTKTHCSACRDEGKAENKQWYFDFATRHKLTHENPGKKIICFVKNCRDKVISRNDETTADEHFANQHLIFCHTEGRAGQLLRATDDTNSGVYKGHITLKLSQALILKQRANLRTAIDKCGDAHNTGPALSKILGVFGGLPQDDDVKVLAKDDSLALLKDIRVALEEVGGDYGWEGMGGQEEKPDDWSDTEEGIGAV